jgi:hypothetical protein
MKPMNSKDKRIKMLPNHWDPRINFICLDYPDFLEHIDSFDGSSEEVLEEGIEQFVTDIIEAKVNIDLD